MDRHKNNIFKQWFRQKGENLEKMPKLIKLIIPLTTKIINFFAELLQTSPKIGGYYNIGPGCSPRLSAFAEASTAVASSPDHLSPA
jgi:hypothetical protein